MSARSIAQGAEPWPDEKVLRELFRALRTISAVAAACGKGRTSLRDYLLLRPKLREECIRESRHFARPVTREIAEKRVDRARRYVLRSRPDNAAYIAIVRRDPCSYCGAPMPLPTGHRSRLMTLDHIEPRSRGGEEHWENYTGACGLCNGEKSSLPLLQFLLGRCDA